MPSLGVNIAILNDAGEILLTRREDFEVWCLPGGAVDDRESAAQAAIREAHEETGLEVELIRLVGIYSIPNSLRGGSHILVFTARPVGGSLRLAQGETVEIGYFYPDAIPQPLFFDQEQMIQDVLGGIGGSAAWNLGWVWPFEPSFTRRDIYALRDRSGLSRQEFYLTNFQQAKNDGNRLEVEGHKWSPYAYPRRKHRNSSRR